MMSFDIAIAPISFVFSFVLGYYVGKLAGLDCKDDAKLRDEEYTRNLYEENAALNAQINSLRSRINHHCTSLMDLDDHEKND